MANQTTLPLAADQDPFQHITIRNGSIDQQLEIRTQPGETIDGIDFSATPLILYQANALTFQSDGATNWYTVSGLKIAVKVETQYLLNDWIIPATWTTIPDISFTNQRAGGIYLFTAEFPVDVDAGNNANVGFEMRSVVDGVAGDIWSDWQDRASSVRLGIQFTAPFQWEYGIEIHFEAREVGSGTYTMLGQSSGEQATVCDTTGPL